MTIHPTPGIRRSASPHPFTLPLETEDFTYTFKYLSGVPPVNFALFRQIIKTLQIFPTKLISTKTGYMQEVSDFPLCCL